MVGNVAKELTFDQATERWANDLVWAWVNTQIARKNARLEGRDEIHATCTEVAIKPGDPRRQMPIDKVLLSMGHGDILESLFTRRKTEAEDYHFTKPLCDWPVDEATAEIKRMRERDMPMDKFQAALRLRYAKQSDK